MVTRRRPTRAEVRARLVLIITVGLFLLAVVIADQLQLTNHP